MKPYICRPMTKKSIIIISLSLLLGSMSAQGQRIASANEVVPMPHISQTVMTVDEIMTQPAVSVPSQSQVKKDELRQGLIDAVKAYIRKWSPRSPMSASNIVDMCLRYDYDIPLLLSQAKAETCFGIANRHSNSVFGIIKVRFRHPDEAVEHYIKYMRKNYLPESRTIEDLFKSGFRTVVGNYHYATKRYAPAIRRMRNDILNTTSIAQMQRQYRDIIGSTVKN